MKKVRDPFIRLGLACVLAYCGATIYSASNNVDAAFQAFWDAHSPQEAVKIVPDVIKTGVPFADALKRLKDGRPYSTHVQKGVVKSSYRARSSEYFYAVNVPESYDPMRRYQVRCFLHGGVMRPSNQPRGDGTIGALAGVEQIYIIPYAWADAPWWGEAQLENLSTILDTVKRTYNVDENRVVLSGVSDGGTGAFYIAMRGTTPWASFLPLNGNLMVLRSEDANAGDLFPNNLRNKPFFAVNGGRDPLYPADYVARYISHLKRKGVEVDYEPQAEGGHNTAWWPSVKDSFESFVHNHPRQPLPDKLTWESTGSPVDNRAHWLVIDKLRSKGRNEPELDDVNLLTDVGPMLFDISHASGRVDLVRKGNAVIATARGVSEFTLLVSPDAFDLAHPVKVEANGRVVFDGKVEPSLATLLKWAARDNDRTMLFAAELHIKL